MKKRLIGGVLLLVAAIGVSVVVTSVIGTSQANNGDELVADAGTSDSALATDDNSTDGPTIRSVNAQEADEDESGQAIVRPYVGIMIETLSDDEAESLGIDSGVTIREVVADGPSSGLLAIDDIVTAIDGEAVGSASDVIRIVGASQPDDSLTFTVLRDGSPVDVDVAVGARTHEIRVLRGRQPFAGGPLMDGLFQGGFERFVRGEVVMETEDGNFKTIRAVKGTVQEGSVDENGGRFTLMPNDGSAPVDYQVSADSTVIIGHTGSISGLSSDEPTVVVDVKDTQDADWSVKLVVQGEVLERLGGLSGPHVFGRETKKHRFIGPDHGFGSFEFDFENLPELRERFKLIIPDGDAEEFDEDDLPDITELLESMRGSESNY